MSDDVLEAVELADLEAAELADLEEELAELEAGAVADVDTEATRLDAAEPHVVKVVDDVPAAPMPSPEVDNECGAAGGAPPTKALDVAMGWLILATLPAAVLLLSCLTGWWWSVLAIPAVVASVGRFGVPVPPGRYGRPVLLALLAIAWILNLCCRTDATWQIATRTWQRPQFRQVPGFDRRTPTRPSW